MSQILIQQYLNDLSDLRKFSGSTRESVVREAFKDLLKGWGRSRDLVFVPEYEIETPTKQRRYVDGALLYELRVPFGYWEAKDEQDDLDDEIATKFRRGYPQDNILFEDSRTVVLFQHRREVMRCPVDEVDGLQRLIELFFGYERPEIAEFRKAVEQFKTDLPAVLAALRSMIEEQHAGNAAFRAAGERFLAHGRQTINPSLTEADVREMLIQHILTEEIFANIFNDGGFHRENNVAKALYALEGEFFTGGVKKRTLKGLEPYYAAIRSAAAQIGSHHEKQTFLKVIYEGFYKVYNRKAADRLGVVYTPNEIVRFMVESADWLCQQHFGKRLIDKGVEILDPAAGTGTFITELIEYFRGQPTKLRWKYLEELHANEVAILPYYVANLNVEATYAAVTGEYEEFKNLCFVDTLDNVAGLRIGRGVSGDLFGAVSDENVARIKRQNARKISVIIGNPPYNANQVNENDENKNRAYPEIDRRIKATYVTASKAQKTKLYDMYVRFFRWASDRIEDDGIVAFVTNRSFLDKYGFDGFRNMIAEEFEHVYLVDLGGDVRANPRLSGTTHNVFGIQTGVAISFMIKNSSTQGSRIWYTSRPLLEIAEEKLSFIARHNLREMELEEVQPNITHEWLGEGRAEFKNLLSLVDKKTKSTKNVIHERSILKLYSPGISTNRDEWLYDFSQVNLQSKVELFTQRYDIVRSRAKGIANFNEFGDGIKWSRNLKRRLQSQMAERFDPKRVAKTSYRPFVAKWLYRSKTFIDEIGAAEQTFPCSKSGNIAIAVSSGSRCDFSAIASKYAPSLDMFLPNGAQIICRWRYNKYGDIVDNVTDWSVASFRAHYGKELSYGDREINKDAIFYYTYGILNDPLYREYFAQDLRRELPRVPFYNEFWRWVEWGENLMRLHVNYEAIDPWPLRRLDISDVQSRLAGLTPRPILKANRAKGTIAIDSETQLLEIPEAAWTYRLGNRTALEWVLDQHKERTPKDPTIREKFNTYHFADHKENVIDLLRRVTRVSVETVAITEAMRRLPRT